jgi:hypothetical protein
MLLKRRTHSASKSLRPSSSSRHCHFSLS